MTRETQLIAELETVRAELAALRARLDNEYEQRTRLVSEIDAAHTRLAAAEKVVEAARGMMSGKIVYGIDGEFPVINHPTPSLWSSEWIALHAALAAHRASAAPEGKE